MGRIHYPKRTSSLLLAALLGSGCSLALDFGGEQPCTVDADCVYSDGPGVCSMGVCRPSGGGDSSDDGAATDPTLGGGDMGDATTGGDTAGPLGCAANTDCAMDQRCGPDGDCLALLSAECQVLQYPDEGSRDDVVFVGSIFPTGGAFANLVQPLENAMQLGVEDFNSETTLQGDRRVAWVGCDSTAGTDAAVNAARHLVDNVGVPAIIGPVFSESVLAVAQDVTMDAGVFLMTPTASAMSITALADNSLVWRTIAPDVYQSNAIVDRMVDLAPARLLVLAKDDAYGNGILNAITGPLESSLSGVEIYTSLYDNPTDFASQEDMLASYGAVLAGAITSLPQPFVDPEDHFTDVLIIGTSEAQSLLYAYLGTWATFQVAPPDPSPPMPRFTFSHGGVPDMERYISDIGALAGTEPLAPLKPLILSKLEGVTPVVFDAQNFDAFNIRYRIRYQGQDALTSSSLSYDAVLSTIFAMCTVPADQEVTGTAVSQAMVRLKDPSGTFVSFSGQALAFITQARNALVLDGGSTDLRGVSGELQWDDAGDIRADNLGWSLVDTDPPNAAARLVPSRVYLLNDEPATDGVWMDAE